MSAACRLLIRLAMPDTIWRTSSFCKGRGETAIVGVGGGDAGACWVRSWAGRGAGTGTTGATSDVEVGGVGIACRAEVTGVAEAAVGTGRGLGEAARAHEIPSSRAMLRSTSLILSLSWLVGILATEGGFLLFGTGGDVFARLDGPAAPFSDFWALTCLDSRWKLGQLSVLPFLQLFLLQNGVWRNLHFSGREQPAPASQLRQYRGRMTHGLPGTTFQSPESPESESEPEAGAPVTAATAAGVTRNAEAAGAGVGCRAEVAGAAEGAVGTGSAPASAPAPGAASPDSSACS